jgi:tetratricopeptide (TPR) repeat protein
MGEARVEEARATAMRCPDCHRRMGPAGCLQHGAARPAEPRDAPPAPATIAAYTIDGALGSGGFADVVAARDRDGRAVAIKIGRARGDRRLEREAELLARVGAPAAPALFGHGTLDDGRPWLAMERCAGSLAARAHDAADARIVAAELARLAGALARVHAAGVVHRDLTPDNVLERSDGSFALVDFGLAALTAPDRTEPGLTRTDERFGTAHYMAPEAWRGATEVGPAADVYALGVIAYERLTGVPPFVGDVPAIRDGHVSGRAPAPSRTAPSAAILDDLVARCLAKDPAARPTADAVVAALASLTDAPAPQPAAIVDGPAWIDGAVLALRTSLPATRVAALAAEAGAIPGAAAGLQLVAFAGAPSPTAAVRDAIALARRVRQADRAAVATVHRTALRLRAGARASVAGPALRDPSWATPTTAGVWLTATAAALVPADERGATADAITLLLEPGELPALDARAIPLRGRDELVATLRAALATRPALATVLGEPGLGTSRVLAAVTAGTDAIALAAGDADRDARALLTAALALPADADAAALDAAWAALAPDLPAASRAAAALALAVITDDAPAVAAITAAPGALRHALARAVAAALVGRARRAPLTVVIDDAHRLDPALLDALELATLAGTDAPLAIVVGARPSLITARPTWSQRAASSAIRTLAPLAGDDARAAMADLLAPAQFVARPVLDRLVAAAAGRPAGLADLARLLRAAGAIRRAAGGGHYLATEFLAGTVASTITEAGPITPTDGDLAGDLGRRRLAALPPALRPLADLCAIADSVTAAAVAGVQAALPADDALQAIDPGAGLARLVATGVAVPPAADADRVALAALVAPYVRRGLDPARARQLHRAVLAWLDAQPTGAPPAAIAHHAAGAGDPARAASAFLAVAAAAERRHRYAEAELAFTSAAELATAPDTQQRALAGRGRMRYRGQRFAEALTDLEAARHLAAAAGDHRAELTLLLEEATALDWCQDAAGSAARLAAARPLLAALDDTADAISLRARAALADGRAHYRGERLADAIAALTTAATLADRAGDAEAGTIARLLLGPGLVYAGDDTTAERVLAEVVDRCRAAGDDFHLAAALTNRPVLWLRRQDLDRCVADLEACVALARELGNPQLERGATCNLAEVLYTSGDLERALGHARRAFALVQSFFSGAAAPEDALLIARIRCALGDPGAGETLAWLDATGALAGAPPSLHLLADLARLTAAAITGHPIDEPAWDALADRARAAALLDESIEVAVLAAEVRRGPAARRWLDRATTAAAGRPLWSHRIARLTAALADD